MNLFSKKWTNIQEASGKWLIHGTKQHMETQ